MPFYNNKTAIHDKTLFVHVFIYYLLNGNFAIQCIKGIFCTVHYYSILQTHMRWGCTLPCARCKNTYNSLSNTGIA